MENKYIVIVAAILVAAAAVFGYMQMGAATEARGAASTCISELNQTTATLNQSNLNLATCVGIAKQFVLACNDELDRLNSTLTTCTGIAVNVSRNACAGMRPPDSYCAYFKQTT